MLAGGPALTYKLKWFVANELVDNIRGVERSYRLSVEFRRPLRLGRLHLNLPLRHGMRADDAEGHRALIFRLNRHIGKQRIEQQQEAGSGMTAAAGGVGSDLLRRQQPLLMLSSGAAGASSSNNGNDGWPVTEDELTISLPRVVAGAVALSAVDARM